LRAVCLIRQRAESRDQNQNEDSCALENLLHVLWRPYSVSYGPSEQGLA
jgi:hypothetical protein